MRPAAELALYIGKIDVGDGRVELKHLSAERSSDRLPEDYVEQFGEAPHMELEYGGHTIPVMAFESFQIKAKSDRDAHLGGRPAGREVLGRAPDMRLKGRLETCVLAVAGRAHQEHHVGLGCFRRRSVQSTGEIVACAFFSTMVDC